MYHPGLEAKHAQLVKLLNKNSLHTDDNELKTSSLANVNDNESEFNHLPCRRFLHRQTTTNADKKYLHFTRLCIIQSEVNAQGVSKVETTEDETTTFYPSNSPVFTHGIMIAPPPLAFF